MKKTYKLDICGRVSTFYEDTVFVLAESEQEANLMGVEAFRDIVQERFNFADVEVVSVKECTECQQITNQRLSMV